MTLWWCSSKRTRWSDDLWAMSSVRQQVLRDMDRPVTSNPNDVSSGSLRAYRCSACPGIIMQTTQPMGPNLGFLAASLNKV